jgi:hypothetical protein
MKISSVKNEFGDPIGLPVGEVTRPGLPDESVMLTGNYCYLEVLDADKHAAELWSVYSLDTDGRLWTYMPQGPFSSESEYRTWVEGVAHKADPFFYAIIDSETNKAVGVASYLRVDPNNYSIEVGWITYSPVIQQKPIDLACLLKDCFGKCLLLRVRIATPLGSQFLIATGLWRRMLMWLG